MICWSRRFFEVEGLAAGFLCAFHTRSHPEVCQNKVVVVTLPSLSRPHEPPVAYKSTKVVRRHGQWVKPQTKSFRATSTRWGMDDVPDVLLDVYDS